MLVGVDLDNTIIKYDGLFRRLAAEQGWVGDDGRLSKKGVRDAMWAREGGHQAWTDLQALVYGPRIVEAQPFPGALAFFERCGALGVRVCIVSHKSEYAASDRAREHNLRDKGLEWLDRHGFFGPGSPLAPEAVHFAGTRQEKVAIIARLGCTLFIDDLIEVFEEPGYPESAQKVLFAPSATAAPEGFDGELCTHWDRMTARLEALHAAR